MTPSEARGILGLSHEAGLNDLQEAYKKRSQFMHPGRFGDRPEGEIKFATAEFQRLTTARDILREHLSRASDYPTGDGSYPRPAKPQETGEAAPATYMAVAITRDQAFAGNVIVVHTPAGQEVCVRLPKAINLNLKLRVRGKGGVMLSPGVQNDLIVEIQLGSGQESPSSGGEDEGSRGTEWAPSANVATDSVDFEGTNTGSNIVAAGSVRRRNIDLVLVICGILLALVFTILLFVFSVDDDKDTRGVQDTVSPLDLEAGACLQHWEQANASFVVVACATPHNAQLVATDRFPENEPFPGAAALEARVSDVCAMVEYSDTVSAYQGLMVSKFVPTEQSWAAGDRRVDCFVVAPENQELTESLLAE